MSPASYRAAPPRVVVLLNYTGVRRGDQIRVGASILNRSAKPLHLAALLLPLDASLSSGPAGSGRPTMLGRSSHRITQRVRQPIQRGPAVLPLRSAVGRGDREASVMKTVTQTLQRPLSEHLRDARARCEIERDLNARVSGVDALPTRAAGATEPPPEFVCGNGYARPHHEILIHATSMAQADDSSARGLAPTVARWHVSHFRQACEDASPGCHVRRATTQTKLCVPPLGVTCSSRRVATGVNDSPMAATSSCSL